MSYEEVDLTLKVEKECPIYNLFCEENNWLLAIFCIILFLIGFVTCYLVLKKRNEEAEKERKRIEKAARRKEKNKAKFEEKQARKKAKREAKKIESLESS